MPFDYTNGHGELFMPRTLPGTHTHRLLPSSSKQGWEVILACDFKLLYANSSFPFLPPAQLGPSTSDYRIDGLVTFQKPNVLLDTHTQGESGRACLLEVHRLHPGSGFSIGLESVCIYSQVWRGTCGLESRHRQAGEGATFKCYLWA